MLARMLLVEDEDAVAVTLPSILEAEGHPVDEILRHDGTIRILHGCSKVVVGDTRQMARRRGVTPALAEHGTAEATAESIRTRRLQLETIPVKPCQWAVLHLMAPSPERWHISAPGPDTEEPGWLS